MEFNQWIYFKFTNSDTEATIRLPIALSQTFLCVAQDVGRAAVTTGVTADGTTAKLYRNKTDYPQMFYVGIIGKS